MVGRRLAERLEPWPSWPRPSWADATAWRPHRPAHKPPAVKPFKLKAPAVSERQLHKSVAKLLDWLLLPPAFYTTFPAGWGWLPKSTAGALYACGLQRGMPDVLIFDVGRVVGVELKVGSAKPTSDQRAMHAKLWAIGIRVYVCKSQEDVIGVLELEGLPMHQHWMNGVQHGAKGEQGTASCSAEESAQGPRA